MLNLKQIINSYSMNQELEETLSGLMEDLLKIQSFYSEIDEVQQKEGKPVSARGASNIEADLIERKSQISKVAKDLMNEHTSNITNNLNTGNDRKGIASLIEKVIFDGPATVILWKNGRKTVAKCSENDNFDWEKGIALCILEYLLGDKSYNEVFKMFKPENIE